MLQGSALESNCLGLSPDPKLGTDNPHLHFNRTGIPAASQDCHEDHRTAFVNAMSQESPFTLHLPHQVLISHFNVSWRLKEGFQG